MLNQNHIIGGFMKKLLILGLIVACSISTVWAASSTPTEEFCRNLLNKNIIGVADGVNISGGHISDHISIQVQSSMNCSYNNSTETCDLQGMGNINRIDGSKEGQWTTGIACNFLSVAVKGYGITTGFQITIIPTGHSNGIINPNGYQPNTDNNVIWGSDIKNGNIIDYFYNAKFYW